MKRAIFKLRRLNELPRLCIWRNLLNVPVSDQFYKHIIFISINISSAAILCLPSSAPHWKCVVNTQSPGRKINFHFEATISFGA